ncbi:MAG: hypothetical protein VX252_03395 [Myxococcota bacterium]|nr:hypothetical protein [Myxococcota bacterium]
MKIFKWLGILAIVYIAFVFFFEGFVLGYLQPNSVPDYLKDKVEVIELRTTDSSGDVSRRRVAGFGMDGKLYASAHHWPRGWYHNAVANPELIVERDNVSGDYIAVPISGEEFDRVAEGFPLSFPVRFAMGFPPERQILRLDPVNPNTEP